MKKEELACQDRKERGAIMKTEQELKDCKVWGGKSDDLRDFLNGIFKEGNDENARTL